MSDTEARDEHGRWVSGGGSSTEGISAGHRAEQAATHADLYQRPPSVMGSDIRRIGEGDRVRIVGGGTREHGRTGVVHQVSPTGEYVGVAHPTSGTHMGYYHVSDLKKKA